MPGNRSLGPFYLLVVIAAILWSLYQPRDLFTWLLEALPVLVALPLLGITFHKFQLTNFVYFLIMLHCVVLLVGAHYTYAEVPLFNHLRDQYGLSRNHYDRVGHFVQGFVPAMVGRELLLRTSPLKPGKWLFALLLLSCMGISATYELFEWLMSSITGEAATAFLGTQGDIWDTQKDMLMAGVGAATSLIIFAPLHDRGLRKLTISKPIA